MKEGARGSTKATVTAEIQAGPRRTLNLDPSTVSVRCKHLEPKAHEKQPEPTAKPARKRAQRAARLDLEAQPQPPPTTDSVEIRPVASDLSRFVTALADLLIADLLRPPVPKTARQK